MEEILDIIRDEEETQKRIRELDGKFCLSTYDGNGTIYSFDEVKGIIDFIEYKLKCKIDFDEFCKCCKLYKFDKIYKPSEVGSVIAGDEFIEKDLNNVLTDDISFNDFDKLLSSEEFGYLWSYSLIPGNDWDELYEEETQLIAVEVEDYIWLTETGDTGF